MEFTNEKINIVYLKENDLLKYFSEQELKTIEKKYKYTDVYFGNNSFYREKNVDKPFIPYPIDVNDLVNLHKTILKRKVFTVMEFGLGYSTIIMADAILKHKKEYDKLTEKPHIRVNDMFKIFSIDTNNLWIKNFEEKIKKFPEIKDIIEVVYSDIHINTFNGRICHFYDNLPSINPQMIYIDGPDTKDVKGNINGFTFNNPDITVMSGDPLLIEPILIPGTIIIFDGRKNNSYFLKNNFQRNWKYTKNKELDIDTYELIDESLGVYNTNMLEYCNINDIK